MGVHPQGLRPSGRALPDLGHRVPLEGDIIADLTSQKMGISLQKNKNILNKLKIQIKKYL
jgi:hypothetical protein